MCFSSPAREAFGWNWKKKQCQNQTKVVVSATGALHFHVHFQTCGWLNVAFSSRCLREGGRKTFFFCVVWWKKTIGSMSHTIRYSNSMMLSVHAHSSKIWANFNAFLRCSGGSLQRASLHGHREPKATMPPVEIAELGLCWEQWGLALTKSGCVLDWELKTH